jgi:hypothetical protein
MMRLRNNIIYQLPGEIYMDGNTLQITGESNLWFGAGSGPETTKNNVNADPQLVNPSGGDFHLQGGSPVRDAGLPLLPNNPFALNPGQATDKDGVPRGPRKFSLGAYELP